MLNRESRLFFLVNLSFSLGMGLYGFVMPAYARQLGATPAQFGALISVSMAAGTLAVIPGGYWADRYDRQLLMRLGWGMCLPVPLIFAAAPDWLWLIPGYALFFLSFFCNPAINAYVSSIADPKRLGSVWGVINSAFPLGFVVGPAVGAAIIAAAGMRVVFLCTFACYLVSFGLLFLLPRASVRGASQQDEARVAEATRHPGGVSGVSRHERLRRSLVPVAVMFAFFYLLAGIGQNYIAMYLQDTRGLELSGIGVFGSAAALGGFIAAPLIGRLRDGAGPRVAMPVALTLVAAAYAGLLYIAAPAGLFAVLALRGGENGLYSLGQAEVSARSSPHELGRRFAAFNVLTGIGSTIGPYAGGVLYVQDVRWPFLFVIVGCLLLAVTSRLLPAAANESAMPEVELSPGEVPV